MHVILQTPDAHATVEPAPTEWVQLAPAHATLQFAPQEPVQVEPALQFRRQPAVLSLHALNPQVWPGGHSQEVPLQNCGAHAVKRAEATTANSAKNAPEIFIPRLYRPHPPIATPMMCLRGYGGRT